MDGKSLAKTYVHNIRQWCFFAWSFQPLVVHYIVVGAVFFSAMHTWVIGMHYA